MRTLLLLSLIVLIPSTSRAGELFVASWNVENLFDTIDDPDVEGDEEFTPMGKNKWTPERLKRKLKNLSGVISSMNGGKGPDILGVAEIENRLVLKMLVAELAPLNRDYQIVHQDSPSGRGIDTAIFFDAKKVKLLSSTFVAIDAENTRDSTIGEFLVGGNRLFVSMNHWPARSHEPSFRIKAAKTVRDHLDERIKAIPNARILVMGDLNDEGSDPSIKTQFRTAPDLASRMGDQFLDSAVIPPTGEKGSYVYKERWEFIDHILVSPGLLESSGLRWRPKSTIPYVTPAQIFTPNNPNQIPRPNRMYTGPVYHATGISDHLPLITILEY